MMNRLWVRLSVSFVLVTWVAIAVVAGLMNSAVESNFGDFLNRSNSLRFGFGFMDEIKAYYAQNASWEGIDAFLQTQEAPRQGGGGQGAQMFIADPDGTIVYATEPTWVDLYIDDIGASRMIELTQDGEQIGILGEQTRGTIALNEAEQQFLQDTTTGLRYTTLVAGILAFAFGIVISHSLTRPLRSLANKVGQMSVSDLGQSIHIKGTREISQLAAAFNDLSFRLAREERRRQRMTGDIAHELRTPVTVMRGHVEAMMDNIYPLDVEHLAIAYDQILHLARLIEDLSLLTKAEAGQLSLNKTTVEPGELITQAAQRFQPLTDDSQISLKIDVESDLPAINIDVSRVRQALDNLITNALRHTDENGQITLSMHYEMHKGIVIRVQNTGKPISAEYVDHIFDRFWRANEARERDAGGTGLGLAITRLLIELHGGSIGVVPTQDGTIFEITLPM